MLILHDPRCADYGSSMRPEQPSRVIRSAQHLREQHPAWEWQVPSTVDENLPRLAHSDAMLLRLESPPDFDADTPFFPHIAEHARRAVAAAVGAAAFALEHRAPVFSLMRPPGHHATATEPMGFCYMNSIAVAALHAQKNLGAARVAVWDFDAHHGNGTEAILLDRENFFFASVHQVPGYPGTGMRDRGARTRNWPVPPRAPRENHLAALRESLDAVVAFQPDLVLVSAGFDAYADDPITTMSLEVDDFAALGRNLRASGCVAAAILEGGYSSELPWLIDAFLSAWDKPAAA